jgi:hypothetical protein
MIKSRSIKSRSIKLHNINRIKYHCIQILSDRHCSDELDGNAQRIISNGGNAQRIILNQVCVFHVCYFRAFRIRDSMCMTESRRISDN